MANPKSQAKIFFDIYHENANKADAGDATAKDLVTRLQASPKFARLIKTYGAETGNSRLASWADGKHKEAVTVMKGRNADYNHNLDSNAMKVFEDVDKTYAAQKPTPTFDSYKAEKDDTLSKIVADYYDLKDPTEVDTAYKAVARSNKIADPNKISIDQEIRLPQTLPLTASQIATTPSAKATPEEITKMVKTIQEDLFGPEKDASGKINPEVDGKFGPKTAEALRAKHGDVKKEENFDKLPDNLKAAVKDLRYNVGPGLFDQGKPAVAPATPAPAATAPAPLPTPTPVPSPTPAPAAPAATPAKATQEEITKAVKTLQESVFKNKGPNGAADPRADGMFGPQTAKALRGAYGDLTKDSDVNKLSPDLKAAVTTLRDNIGPGLFEQDKVIPKRTASSSHKQRRELSNAFDGATLEGSTYEERLASLRRSREGKPFNAEAEKGETIVLNTHFGRVNQDAPQSPSITVPAHSPEVSLGTGRNLNPAKGGPGAFYP